MPNGWVYELEDGYMNSEQILIYFLMFFLYCMVGWVWESIYMSVIEKRIQNRGFLHGPYIPIYGFAGMIVYFTLGRLSGPLLSVNTVIIYFVSMFCATCLELITATLAEKILGRQLWDYTIYKINYKGKIALIASLFWGVAATTFVQILNPAIIKWFTGFPAEAKIICVSVMATLMGVDTLFTAIGNSKLPGWWDEKYTFVNGKWEKFMCKITG